MLLDVFIPTHNRLPYLLESVNSVLAQKINNKNINLRIFVSDNSSNDVTENYFKSNWNNYPDNFFYKRRAKLLTGIEHLSQILSEVESDYFLIFHDDDIMLPGMLNELLESFEKDIVAVASNAYIFSMSPKKAKLFCKKMNDMHLYSNKRDFLRLYLFPDRIVPFPGYMYKKCASSLGLDTFYGKYLDVHFLSNLFEFGKIKLLKKPLFFYRQHNAQDSFISDFIAKSRLTRYLISVLDISKNDRIIVKFRLRNIYDEYRTQIFKGKQFSNLRLLFILKTCLSFFYFTLALKIILRIVVFKMKLNKVLF